MKPELRRFAGEIRAAEDGTISGFLLRWGEAGDIGWFRERFQSGAFADSLAARAHDIVALWSHDWSKPMASRDAGRLLVEEREAGPFFEFTPNQASWSRDAVEAIKSGSTRGMSFGFVTVDASWETVDGAEIRTVTKADLYEISPVVLPAYASSTVEARSAEEVWNKHLEEAGAASTSEKRGSGVDVLLALNKMKGRKR